MVARDEWFSIHATQAEPDKDGAGATPTVSFRVDPEYVPAVKTAFTEAIQEMTLARQAAQEMAFVDDGDVDPVLEKYLRAMLDRATGEEGSFTVAADSAIKAYQSVIDQLDQAIVAYQQLDDEHASGFGG